MIPPTRLVRLLTMGAISLGCVALSWRPGDLAVVVAVTVAVGAIGVLGPLPNHPAGGRRTRSSRWAIAVTVGMLAFAAARMTDQPAPVAPLTLPLLVGIAVASVAEEAFFRRYVYGWLAAWGPGFAVAIAAAAFAAVHVPATGLPALPLNLAAGTLWGWQRWATGGWSAPAITHIAANLMQVG